MRARSEKICAIRSQEGDSGVARWQVNTGKSICAAGQHLGLATALRLRERVRQQQCIELGGSVDVEKRHQHQQLVALSSSSEIFARGSLTLAARHTDSLSGATIVNSCCCTLN
jgi:hypothetical protein